MALQINTLQLLLCICSLFFGLTIAQDSFYDLLKVSKDADTA